MSEFSISCTIEYPYTRPPGPVIEPFLTALRDGRILCIRIAVDRHEIGFAIAGGCDYLSGRLLAFTASADAYGA